MPGLLSFQGQLSKAEMVAASAREEARQKEDRWVNGVMQAAKTYLSEYEDDRDSLASSFTKFEQTLRSLAKIKPNTLRPSPFAVREPAAETSNIEVQGGSESRSTVENLEPEAVASKQPEQKRANSNGLSPSKDTANGLAGSIWARG